MTILTIANLGPEGGLLIGGSDQEVALSRRSSDQREAASEVFRYLIQDCPPCFVEALARRLIAHKAENDPSLAMALAADPSTRYLLEMPT